MMTDYNDGKWHGWNGGECPVHPDSVVECVTKNYGPQSSSANSFGWWRKDHINPIVAFRVTKQHKEPREFWYNTLTGKVSIEEPFNPHGDFIHVREVTE